MRDYGVEPQIWDGNGSCEHQWSNKITTIAAGQSYGANSTSTLGTGTTQARREEVQKEIGMNTKISSSFCSLCGAWRGSLGLEPTFELYIKHLCDIYDEVFRILRPDGTCWVNLADTYANNPSNQQGKGVEGSNVGLREGARSLGRQNRNIKTVPTKSLCLIPQRFAIEMVNRGWILRNVIIWHKCLSGNTPIYAKSQDKVLRATIREISRLPLDKLYLAGKDGWRRVIRIEKQKPRGLLTIHLRNGMRIECSPNHRFEVGKYYIPAKDLYRGQKLNHAQLPDEKGTPLGDYDNGWAVGYYLAEGSLDGKGLQFSAHKKEDKFSGRIKRFAVKYAGTHKDYNYGNSKYIKLSGEAAVGVIKNYIFGDNAKNKRLSRAAFQEDNIFLRGVLDGYLAGDGHYEEKNNRWRIGFTLNRNLEYDLRVICNRLSYNMRAKMVQAKCNGKAHPSIRGEIRKARSGHFNQKDDYEILRIEKTKGITYEIEVDGDHLFLLCDGTITHNSNPMPSSAKDRFTVDFEYVYFFVKSKKYWFEPQYEKCLTECNAERPRMGQGQNTQYNQKRGEAGRYQRGYKSNKFGFKQDVSHPLGRNKRTVWTIPTQSFSEAHFATFPEKLIEPIILAGCPEFICTKCGKGREKIYDRQIPPEEAMTNNKQTDDKLVKTSANRYGKGQGQKLQNWPNEHPPAFKGHTDCGCKADFRPGIVLDPFCGSGTTCLVAAQNRRDYIGIELKPEYIEMANKRISAVETGVPVKEQRQGQKGLFE